jgi:hypothetical protein
MTMTEEELDVTPGSNGSPRLDEAERDVARAQAQFSADLQRMSSAGRKLTGSIMKTARPALLGVAVVTGVLLIVAVWRSRSRPSPRIVLGAQPQSSSLVRDLSSLAVRSLAVSAGRHLAEKLMVLAGERVERARLNGASERRRPFSS